MVRSYCQANQRISLKIPTNKSGGLCLEEVGHASAVLPTLLGDPAVPLDDDVDDLLLAGADVDNLDLAVFEAKDKISTIDIPRRSPFTLTAFLNVNYSHYIYKS